MKKGYPLRKKIFRLNEMIKLQNILKGKKIVLVGGCFDLLHYGHLIFLTKARSEGDVLVVLLESDQFLKKTKSKNPVHDQLQRAEILASLEMVDYVLLLPLLRRHEEYYEIVKKIRPAVIATTKGDKKIKYKKDQAKKFGAKLKLVTAFISPFSTHSILKYANFSRH